MFPQPEQQPSYNSVYSQVEEDLGKVGIPFSKKLKRRPLMNPMHDLDYTDKPFTAVEPRAISPDFSKVLSRPETSMLPSFMSMVPTRLAMDTLHDKMLEMNSYCEVGSVRSTS
jgi:hypothetical protein